LTDAEAIQVELRIYFLHVSSGDSWATFIFERGVKVLENLTEDIAVLYFMLDEGAFDYCWLLVFFLFVVLDPRPAFAAWIGDDFGKLLELVEDDVAVFGALFVDGDDLVDDLFEVVVGDGVADFERVFLV